MASISSEAITNLYSMLQTMRPHGSKAELEFSKRHLLPLGVKFDSFGNGLLKVGDVPVAWSCHVDTVHRHGGTQQIVRDDKFRIKLAATSKSNCLGADDTAGVWIMCEMIRAKMPGLYLFHRGEEVGGKGSDFIVEHTPNVVKGIKFMVAFDRKGYDSVITHQAGGRCCSDDFGKALAVQLGEDYKLDKYGSFTDSANYTDLIGECTNVSVGYLSQHCASEELSLTHLVQLRQAMLQLDPAKLVEKRKPGEKEPLPTYNYNNWRGNHDYEGGPYGASRYYEDYDLNWYSGGYWNNGKWTQCTKAEWQAWKDKKTPKEKDVKPATSVVPLIRSPEQKVEDFCKNHPLKVAMMLLDWGFDINILKDNVAEVMIREQRTKDGHEPVVM